MRFVRKEIWLQLTSTLLLMAIIFGAVRVILAESPGANGTNRAQINGRPLINNVADPNKDQNSNHQTVDGRPLRQPLGSTEPPQPSLWDRTKTNTKNFFGKMGSWFSKSDGTSTNNDLVRPSTAASKKEIDAAQKININGNEIPVGYGPDGRRR